jgi:ferredoxin
MILVFLMGKGIFRANPTGLLKGFMLRGKGRRRNEKLINALDIWGVRPHIYTPTTNFMADIANRYGDNVAGKFYVDNQCIDCDLCRETAPDNFTRSDDGGYSYVYKQPVSPEEEARCKEAMEGCPVEAIGNNGDGA